jgi:Mce-associated membrane protein
MLFRKPDKNGSMRDMFRTKSHSWQEVGLAREITARAARKARRQAAVLIPLLVGVLVAVLAAALAAAGVSSHRWYVDRATDQARQAAVAAARQTTVNFVSVSAASVDRDLQRISAGATGEFKEQFTRGQSQVRQAVVENKVESHGSVLRAGLVSGDRRSAVVLVAVDATVKNVKAPEGRPSHYRIQVDMVRDKDTGEWLVSRLQFVG